MKWPAIFALFFTLASAVSATAQNLTPAEKARDQEVAQRAKQRQYPGGPDESDLKVQNPQPAPTRKIAPSVTEEKPESGDSDGHD